MKSYNWHPHSRLAPFAMAARGKTPPLPRRSRCARGFIHALLAIAFGAACNPVVPDLTTGEDIERAALTALYYATGGDGWTQNDKWVTEAPLHEWENVHTNDAGRVTILSLDNNGLMGRIPAQLGNLDYLRALHLEVNELSGPIPPELGGLRQLEELLLNHNKLTDGIPRELGDLESLEQLVLDWNEQLGGSIPSELANLDNLQHLSLWQTDISGQIPPELGSLPNLEVIDLNANRLTGPVPPEIAGAVGLEELLLSGNRLTGPIPAEFTQLHALYAFTWEANDGLCAPADEEFQDWLAGIGHAVGPTCEN